MKRVGNLMPEVIRIENLKSAFWKASRGLRERTTVIRFQSRLDENLKTIRAGILSGGFPVGRVTRFVIHDPKKRVIHAPAFPERILHHALINVCEPILERATIGDSYACRKGRGQLAAVRRAEYFAARHQFFLKLDVRKFFDSIHHERLLGMLERIIKDRAVLGWFRRIVESFETNPGRGIPMGSLVSQHLANFYLHRLDHWVKEELRFAAYVRYMDDFVLWHDSARLLVQSLAAIRGFLETRMQLSLKPEPFINRTTAGMDFLGYRIRPGFSVLNRRSRNRYRRKLIAANGRLSSGEWSEGEYQRRVEALTSFTLNAASTGFRRRVLSRLGVFAQGLEPRESRRELEQRGQELPVGQPEQE